MTASAEAKAAGFKSLAHVAELFGVTTQCLRNWHKDEPQKFNIVLLGCKAYIDSCTRPREIKPN